MCNYRIWFHDEKAGYVVECKRCNKMQLCFGNIIINFEKKDFQSFYEYVIGVQKEQRDRIDKYTKSIVLSTPNVGISFILTAAELDGLCRMTDYVDTEIKTSALIKMFGA